MTRLFIADLHLRPERPDLIRAFIEVLRHQARQADELYLLGDIFEAWIGDDAPMPGLETVYGELAKLAEHGTAVFFQHGNRDFLVGQGFMDRIQAKLLPDQYLIERPQGPILLLHGDQLCTDDADYQAFRDQVRNPAWQQAFLAKPIEERLAIARQLREASKARGMAKSESIMDVNPLAVTRTLQDAGVELMIHGHTHRPAIHHDQIRAGRGTRIVLGDWDRNGWYLEVDEDGFALIEFPIRG